MSESKLRDPTSSIKKIKIDVSPENEDVPVSRGFHKGNLEVLKTLMEMGDDSDKNYARLMLRKKLVG